MESANCPCCNSSSLNGLKNNLLECNFCHHLFIKDILIQDYKTKHNRNNRNLIVEKKNKERFQFLEGIDFGTLIDIGCAEGFFGLHLKTNRKLKRVDGLELSEDYSLAVNYLDNVYNFEVKEVDKFPVKYDMLTLFHVLEHIEKPKQFLHDCMKLTTNYLCIEVPYNSGNNYIEYDLNLEHLHFFSCSSLINLLESIGLCIIKCETGGFESPRYNNCIRVIAIKNQLIRRNLYDKLIDCCGNKFFVYGAGGNYKAIIEPIEGIKPHIIGVMDKNHSLSASLDNYIEFNIAVNRTEKILISSIDFFDEMKFFLITNGFPEKRIIGIEDIIAS
jgi:hypothetical protein